MTESTLSAVLEDAIRLRSYLIWEREGCPKGRECDHWLRAEAQIYSELRAVPPLRRATSIVVPRMPISRPPRRSVSARVDFYGSFARVSAAKR